MKIQQSYAKPLMWLSALLMTAVVAGCGGGGKDPILGVPAVTSAATLMSVAVKPANATVPINVIQKFRALATYSDGSISDVTTSSNWVSATPGVATVISTSGVAKGVAAGQSQITANFGDKAASGTLVVSGATLSTFVVTPKNASVQVGGIQPFTAIATYNDNSSRDVTASSIWASGTSSVATVNSTSGIAKGVANGTSVITANFSGKSDTGSLSVVAAAGPAPVLLGAAGNFVILTKAGITDVPSSAITGNIGSSPISGASIGVTCAEVTGTIYAVNAAGPACAEIDPVFLTSAVSDMETAYTDAAGRPKGVGPFLNVGAGTVSNQTLVPGIYTWGSNVTIPTNLTLKGGANDVWIFQISGKLDLSSYKLILLLDGAQTKNIFWQVSDVVTLGTGSHFEGTILAETKIAMKTGASINGRLLAQTEATLEKNVVERPAP